jgi:hypothetical protein
MIGPVVREVRPLSHLIDTKAFTGRELALVERVSQTIVS